MEYDKTFKEWRIGDPKTGDTFFTVKVNPNNNYFDVSEWRKDEDGMFRVATMDYGCCFVEVVMLLHEKNVKERSLKQKREVGILEMLERGE